MEKNHVRKFDPAMDPWVVSVYSKKPLKYGCESTSQRNDKVVFLIEPPLLHNLHWVATHQISFVTAQAHKWYLILRDDIFEQKNSKG